MISQRTRGLADALLFCQALLVSLALWISMRLAFSYFTGASSVHLEKYPTYGAMLILGLFLESLTRDSQQTASALSRRSLLDQHGVSIRQTLFATGALFLYLAAMKDAFISRTVLALDLPLLYTVLVCSNYFLPPFLARRFFGNGRSELAILIGPAERARRLQTWLRRRAVYGFRAIGIINEADEPQVPGLPRLGSRDDLDRVLGEHRITQAILLELPESAESHEKLVEVLENHGTRILILSNLEEKLRHRTIHFQDDGLNFIAPRAEPLEDPVNGVIKRALDVCVALPVVLFFLPPLAAIVWILQRLQSRGPLFFRQVRAGIQNREFTIVKFRTMHVNATEGIQATERDTRIFSGGRWLRRLSLDEMPQFWNVLAGEMSVCGPRPHLVEHNAEFAKQMARYHVRAFVKPGVTGLAQVRGFRGEVRSVADIEARVESDIGYLENWRLALDVMIIFRTGLQVCLFALSALLARPKRSAKDETGQSLPSPALQRQLARAQRLQRRPRAYASPGAQSNFRLILGIRFFTGTLAEAVSLGMEGGLVVVPSAPVLLEVETDPATRAALSGSALAVTDSGLMVHLWNLLTGEDLIRTSGLVYLKQLLEQPEMRAPGATFWVMPSVSSMERNLAWLQGQGFQLTKEDCYVAPQYPRRGEVFDPELVRLLEQKQPSQVIMAIGGGIQEKLGASVLEALGYRPAIHCTGAAIGFLSGEQARIPMWADYYRLGWLFRCLHDPATYIPRYWQATRLVNLMLKYHGRLPGQEAEARTSPGRQTRSLPECVQT